MSITVIKPQELAELCKEGKKIDLIDVRTPVEYREVHVEIARNVPLDQLDPAALMQARNGSANEPLYVICRSGSRGQQACEKFLKAGFSNVVNIEGGTMACVEAGLPVVRGKKAISLERQVRIAAGSLVLLGAVLGWFVHPAFHRAVGFRRSRAGVRRDHRYLWDGHDPGPNAVEPVSRRTAVSPGLCQRRSLDHETAHRRWCGWWSFRSRSCPSPVGRRPNRPVRAGAGRVVRQLRPAVLHRRRDRRAEEIARHDARESTRSEMPLRSRTCLRRPDSSAAGRTRQPQGRIAADNIFGPVRYRGTQGTAIVGVFDRPRR